MIHRNVNVGLLVCSASIQATAAMIDEMKAETVKAETVKANAAFQNFSDEYEAAKKAQEEILPKQHKPFYADIASRRNRKRKS